MARNSCEKDAYYLFLPNWNPNSPTFPASIIQLADLQRIIDVGIFYIASFLLHQKRDRIFLKRGHVF